MTVHVETDVQALVNDLANRYEEAGQRILELEEDLRLANEAFLTLAGQYARVLGAARKVYTHPGFHPNHLGHCPGVRSSPSCDCGLSDLRFAIMALDGVLA